MSRRFEALIVDFGGVLTTPLQDSVELFAEELEIELQDVVRIALSVYSGGSDDLVAGFERGEIPAEDFERSLAERFSQESGRSVSGEGLVERLFGTLTAEESMFEAVGAVKRAGYKTALLSNSWGLGVYPRHRFEGLLDVVVISAEVGMRKPDPEIYAHTTAALGVDPGRCVFVDDHPGHLKPAAAVGMTTVLHRNAARTIEELEGLFEVPLA